MAIVKIALEDIPDPPRGLIHQRDYTNAPLYEAQGLDIACDWLRGCLASDSDASMAAFPAYRIEVRLMTAAEVKEREAA